MNVDGVHRVVFRRHINHIVRALKLSSGNQHARHHQRLSVHLVVERHGPQQAERRGPHVGRRQGRFMFIPSGAVVVVVIGCDSYLARASNAPALMKTRDGKYSRAANAVISFTMSWHVLASFSFLDGDSGGFRSVCRSDSSHGTSERTLKALARLLGKKR